MDELRPYIPLLIPILVLQLGLIVVALWDLARQPATRGPKWLWVVVIIVVNIIGPILYFVVGRRDT
jgi:hypothetical protein